MTNEEILMFFRKAQEQQSKAFMNKKVSYWVETNYTPSIGSFHFSVSVFYGEEQRLFNFSVGTGDSTNTTNTNFAMAEAIINA